MKSKRDYLILAVGVILGAAVSLPVYIAVAPPKAPQREPAQSAPPHASGDCNILGSVKTADGTPLSEAAIYLRRLGSPWSQAHVHAPLTSDNQGAFSHEGLPRDDYQLWAYHPTHGVGTIHPIACDTAADVVVEPGYALNLTYNADGSPPPTPLTILVAGDSLWPPRQGKTNQNGHLVVQGLPSGSYEVWAFNNTHAHLTKTPVTLEEGGPTTLEFALEPARTVELDISNTSGAPLPSLPAVFKAHAGALLSRMISTDGDGAASINGLPASVTRGSLTTLGVFAPVPLDLTQTPLDVQFDTGLILEGTVTTPQGMPIAGVDFNVWKLPTGGTPEVVASTEGGFLSRLLEAAREGLPPLIPLREGLTLAGPSRIPLPSEGIGEKVTRSRPWLPSDGDGRFVLAGLPNEQIRIVPSHPDYVARSPVILNLSSPGSAEPLQLEMRRGSTAAIRIETQDGSPLTGAQITVYDAHEQIVAVNEANPSGFLELAGLPGEIRVVASHPERVSAYRDVTQRTGRHVELQLRLPPATQEMTGVVLGANGNPIPDAFVKARAISKGLIHSLAATTGPDGSFTLSGVGSGSYHVVADAGEKGRAQVGDATAAEPIKLVLGSGLDYTPPPTRHGPALVLDENRIPGASDAPTGNTGSTSSFGQTDQIVVTPQKAGPGTLPMDVIAKGNRVVVSRVSPGSRVAGAGIRKGHILVSVNGKPVKGPSAAKRAFLGTAGSVVMLEVETKSGEIFTAIVQREAAP